MQIKEIVPLLKKAKAEKKMTIQEIATVSNVAVRTVNRIFAGEDVRCSSLSSVLGTLDLSLTLQTKATMKRKTYKRNTIGN